MIKKIVFFAEFKWEKRDHKRFGVDLLKENGFEVEVFNFEETFYPDLFNKIKAVDPMAYNEIHSFSTKAQIVNAISSLSSKDDFVFILLGDTPEKYFIYNALSDNKIRYGFLTTNAMPAVKKAERI